MIDQGIGHSRGQKFVDSPEQFTGRFSSCRLGRPRLRRFPLRTDALFARGQASKIEIAGSALDPDRAPVQTLESAGRGEDDLAAWRYVAEKLRTKEWTALRMRWGS
jgi:hypothetical protein